MRVSLVLAMSVGWAMFAYGQDSQPTAQSASQPTSQAALVSAIPVLIPDAVPFGIAPLRSEAVPDDTAPPESAPAVVRSEAAPPQNPVVSSHDVPPVHLLSEFEGRRVELYGGVSLQAAPLMLYWNGGIVAGLGVRYAKIPERFYIGIGADWHLQGSAVVFSGNSTERGGLGLTMRLDFEEKTRDEVLTAAGSSLSFGVGKEFYQFDNDDFEGLGESYPAQLLTYGSLSLDGYVTLFKRLRVGLGLSFSANNSSFFATMDLCKLGFVF